jgi:hypothetical protein
VLRYESILAVERATRASYDATAAAEADAKASASAAQAPAVASDAPIEEVIDFSNAQEEEEGSSESRAHDKRSSDVRSVAAFSDSTDATSSPPGASPERTQLEEDLAATEMVTEVGVMLQATSDYVSPRGTDDADGMSECDDLDLTKG